MTEIQSIPTDPRFQDLTGKTFGRLTVIAYAGSVQSPNGKNIPTWMVRCECGNEKIIRGVSMKSKKTISCGCARKERSLKSVTTHNMSYTYTYRCWAEMKKRCTNRKFKYFKNYGGRGISVCDRWLESFENFLADMGPAPLGMSIDRFPNNDGNYEPENCRWATRHQQANNTSRNTFITFRGKTLTVAQWTVLLGFSEKLIAGRIRLGWSVEDALTIKPMRGNRYSKSSSKTSQ